MIVSTTSGCRLGLRLGLAMEGAEVVVEKELSLRALLGSYDMYVLYIQYEA